jgi:hypothetical protein
VGQSSLSDGPARLDQAHKWDFAIAAAILLCISFALVKWPIATARARAID